MNTIREDVKKYYGQTLANQGDLRTSACCAGGGMPPHHQQLMAKLQSEIVEKFYGCGSPIPDGISGATVLDLGCGTGRDVYICSALVGQQGRVIGVDMTEAQIAIAEKHLDKQTKRFGLTEPNVTLKHGFIENLTDIGIAENSVDVVISNCVINLSPDKEAVFNEIFRVLKPGGELYFSDVFADRRLPGELREDPVLLGECLAGAMYFEDFRRQLAQLGIRDLRVLKESEIALSDPEVDAKIGFAKFSSKTVRAFKIDSLEDRCEDYGQLATYRGTIEHHPHAYQLDQTHEFPTGKPLPVCGNTADMLSQSRFNEHFVVTGDRSTHYGIFNANQSTPSTPESPPMKFGSCC